jgi:Membrane protein involved in the export of O-antigen and teichoic acid
MLEKNESIKVNKNTILKATKWSFITEIMAKMIVPITNMILARLLVPEIFGIVASINVIISFSDMIADAGFNRYLIQHQYESDNELHKDANVAFWSHFSLSSLLFIVILIFRNMLAEFIGIPGYELPMIVASLSLPLTSLSSIQIALYRRKYEYKRLFFNRILAIITPFIVTIPLALFNFSYWSLIIGTLCGLLVQVINLTYHSEWRPRLFFKFTQLKNMLSFSIWTLCESIALWASSWIDIFIIGNILGSFYTGLYKTSQSTVTGIFNIITSSIISVTFVSLSRVQNDDKLFLNMLLSFQKYLCMLVLPLGAGIFVFKDLITNILLGQAWYEASTFIGVWGLCTAFVASYGTLCREAYRSKGKPKISLIAQLLHLVFVIPVCYFSAVKGFDVLIYTRSFAYLQIIIVHFIFVKLFLNISPYKMVINTGGPLMSSLAMGIFSSALKNSFSNGVLGDIIVIGLSVILYFSLLLIFPSYRKVIIGIIKKGISLCLKKKHY